MAHRQKQSRHRTLSSCSNSSSTSPSPSHGSPLNFTLYGAPAPRSIHRTSSGAFKTKTRRRSTKPTHPPPASPLNSCHPDVEDPSDFKLDLSSLGGDDNSVVSFSGNNVYYCQCDTCINFSCRNEHDKNTTNVQNNTGSDLLTQGNDNGISIVHNSAKSFCNEKDYLSQTCSELDESSQGFGDIDILQENDSYRSNSSSYFTLSQYSINYSTSLSSDDVDVMSENTDAAKEVESRMSESDKKITMKNTECTPKKILNNSNETSTKCINIPINENKIFWSQNLQTNVSPKYDENLHSISQNVENASYESKQVNNLIGRELTIDTGTDIICKKGCCYKQENHYNTDEIYDLERKKSPKLYGYYVFNNDHERPSVEQPINSEQYFCQENSLRKYNSFSSDDLIPVEMENDPINYDAINVDLHTDENNYSRSEKYDGYSDEIVTGLQNFSLEDLSLKSRSNSEPIWRNDRSFIDAKRTEKSELCTSHGKNNFQPNNRIYSTPFNLVHPNISSNSVLTCNCNSGRQTKLLLEHLESGYFSDVSDPNIPMKAGDIMKAVFCARQLVQVLEGALNKALTLNDSVHTPRSESRNYYIRGVKRCRSLSPNMLRNCKSLVSLLPDGENLKGGDRQLDRMKYWTDNKNYNLDISETEPNLLFTYSQMRKHHEYKRDKFPITSEELKKQRTLLKPPAERSHQDTVTHILDMTDILKNVILRRHTLMEPTEELICASNRSVSDWSLESSPDDYEVLQ